MTSFRAALGEPLLSKKFKACLTALVFISVFGFYIVKGIYQDHQQFVSMAKNNSVNVKKEVPPKPSSDFHPPPTLVNPRIASQKQLSSTVKELPYALEVIIQTDKDIEPVSFIVEFDGPIGQGKAYVSGGGVYIQTIDGIRGDKRNNFYFGWRSPTFTPDKTVIVEVLSKTLIRATGLRKERYVWR